MGWLSSGALVGVECVSNGGDLGVQVERVAKLSILQIIYADEASPEFK